MLKFLKGVVDRSVSGIKDFPYNIDEPYSSAWGSWTHCRGTSKDDGSLVSIFYLSGNSSQDGHLLAGRNGVKRLRTVRHPNILSFIHSTEAEVNDGSMTKVTIYIVTEPVMPLSEKIKELNLEAAQRNEYYAWGLSQIAKAVSFLNNDCKLVHGNVCLISIVVTQTLDWKLHAFDVLSEFDGNLEAPNGSMLQYEWLVGSQYKSMELAKSDWALIRKSPPWAIDSWGLGCLIYELFSGMKLCKTEELRNTAAIPKSLLPDYQRLLSSTPSRRLNSSKLIENSEYFNNKLVETIQFMEVLNLKDSVEKDIFFRKLPNIVDQLPRQIVLKKLLPLLASALEFGSTASSSALTTLLKMGSWLSVDEFSIKVLPSIVKLFASSDRAVRVGLLQHVDQFSESLTAQLVDEQIFPYVATGFSDSSAFLRELTVKSMLVLAPKLSQRTLSGSLLKHLSKLQVDEEPAIRTNTTILLGNIASYLNEGMRKRVLINAFTTRALRDDFSPARAAGIMALCATSAYYDMSEIATRVLPNIVVLTIDPDHDVRLKAFQAIDQFLQIARQHHEKVRGIEVDVEQHEKFSIQAAAHHDNLDVTHHTGEHSTSISTPLDHTTPSPSSPTSMDGWREVENGILHDNFESDKEGWDAIEPLEELRPPELASIQAAQKRLFAQPKQHAEHSFRANSSVVIKPSSSTFASAKSNDNDLWGLVATREAGCASKASSAKPKVPGDDGDIWGTIAALPSRTTSKPFKSAVAIDDDPWMAIAAAPPVTKVKPLSSGQGRGVKQTPTKLGAHRIDRTS